MNCKQMNTIRAVQDEADLIKETIPNVKQELEKHCLNETNYNFALKLCQICIAPKTIDEIHSMAIIFFGHLLITYKSETYLRIKEVLGKHEAGLCHQVGFNEPLGNDDFPFFEYMISWALDNDDQDNIDEWQLVRNNINAVLQSQINTNKAASSLSSNQIAELTTIQNAVSQYYSATRYLITTMQYYHEFRTNFFCVKVGATEKN